MRRTNMRFVFMAVCLMKFLVIKSVKATDKTVILLDGMGSYKCGKEIPANVFRIAVLMTNPYLNSNDGDVIKKNPKNLGPVRDLALRQIDKMKQSGLLNGLKDHNFEIFFSEINKRNELQIVISRFFHFILDEPVHAFIGPDSIIPLGTMARMSGTRFNRSLVSLGEAGFQHEFQDKVQYQGLTRIAGNHESLTKFMIKLLNYYNWRPRPFKTIGVLYLEDKQYSDYFYVAIEMMERLNGYKTEGYKTSVKDLKDTKDKLNHIVAFSRIIILCGKPEHVRKVMLLVGESGYNLAEFVFIHIDLFTGFSPQPWSDSKSTNEENEAAKKVFRYLLIVKLPLTELYWDSDRSRELKEIARKDYNYVFQQRQLNYVTTSFYESIILYAIALNDTISKNDTLRHITKYMWNRTFYGFTSPVKIDENGNRASDFALFDLDPVSWNFQQVGFYNGSTDQYVIEPNRDIDWGSPGNKPPKDVPDCGFDGAKCRKDSTNIALILGLVSLCFSIVGIIGGVFAYRRIKFQTELKLMNWIILWDALETYEKRKHRQSKIMQRNSTVDENAQEVSKKQDKKNGKRKKEHNKQKLDEINEMENRNLLFDMSEKKDDNFTVVIADGTRDSGSRQSISSVVTIEGVQLENIQSVHLYIKTALYKGNVVALKKIHSTRRLDPNKEMLLEIKKIKDLNSDHICRFIGICVEPEHQYIVYEYCPKGSLEDLLENDQISLDWMFRFSLIQDIVRGMLCLHSNFGPHGHLKSSNCVVDSRFVLKLTDFGLQFLRGNRKDRSPESKSYSYYKSLLWTSPELLRLSNTPLNGTTKGDVYSFAIIAQEIICRHGVFSNNASNPLEPKETYELIIQQRDVPYRPSLEATESCPLELIKIISQSWDEDPNARPDFVTIRNGLRKINKGKESGNILDNLLSRMEQYANNLEGLVAQRTQEYLEEKKKAEDLLYSMLPKSVAHQLIKNNSVSAESYEQVTIYFSDIVGFTSLSADSTPMQVIELLNRLYTTFDSIIENFDVYKVETIGDAYMVVSGLPKINGTLHAREIARMSLAFLGAIYKFQIPHRPSEQLKLRIGVHSGSVCAGVVGHKMPRYCLFGDTVNTASRMESNGLPLKIHISANTMDVLKSFKSFIMTERGEVEMKGKGKQLTYWLHGENMEIVDPVPDDELIIQC